METSNPTLQKAIDFAQIGYVGIKRKNGEDYINHPMRVMKSLQEIGIENETILAAAILHDLPKLNSTSFAEIQQNFGDDIAYIVETLNKISEIQLPSSEKRENTPLIHKLLIQLSKDVRVLLIRLADRVDNIKTLEGIAKEDWNWIAHNALYIYAPVAKALGIYSFTRELEDYSLKTLEPERYKEIVSYQNRKFKEIEKEVIMAKYKIVEHLKELQESQYDISFRKKGIYSTHLKAKYKAKKGDIQHPSDFDNLYDLLGIRILVETKDACYKVLAFIQENWENIQSEFDDYIAAPKSNGYQSLQTAIKLTPHHNCEVQVRTFDMHNNNEYGASSHFKYKYGGEKGTSVEWIKNLIIAKDNLQSETGQHSTLHLFEDLIFAFTPKGDLITLPKNSTALDFAYAIHTDIGHHCSGALINDKIKPLNTIIKSGDKVEILTQKNRKPSLNALEMANSSEAKRQIRKMLIN